jgi:segregation and condensation protein A
MPEETTPPEERKPKERDYVVSLPSFEGPLDLLLHLIQKHELDIFDIPVSFVTEKYLAYINLMQELSIDVASEYLVMAATLAHIKSKSLLPNEPTTDEDGLGDEEEGDPRAELIRRLLEYQKYKQAAADLNERGALGRDVFLRGTHAPEADGPAPLAPVELWSLLDAFGKVLARAKVDLQHEVSFDRMSITDRITQLMERLQGKSQCRFEDLFDGQRTRFDLIITFLALLEMTRLKMTRLYQTDPLSDIFIETAMVSADTAPAEVPEPAV